MAFVSGTGGGSGGVKKKSAWDVIKSGIQNITNKIGTGTPLAKYNVTFPTVTKTTPKSTTNISSTPIYRPITPQPSIPTTKTTNTSYYTNLAKSMERASQNQKASSGVDWSQAWKSASSGLGQGRNNQAQQTQTETQEENLNFDYGWNYEGGGGFSFPEYPGFTWNFQIPEIPGEYILTPEDWEKFKQLAELEANQLFDPQILDIATSLQKTLLTAEASKEGITAPYEDILAEVDEWQKQTLEEEQRRAFARGMGLSGELIKQETKIGETALKTKASAEREKAAKLAELEAQKLGLVSEAEAKKGQLVKNKAEYIITRQNELAEQYKQNKELLAQRQFDAKMAIQQLGLNAETQRFNQWLQSVSIANDIWYNNTKMALEKMSLDLSRQQMEMENRRSGYSGLTPYQMAELEYKKQALAQDQAQFMAELQYKYNELKASTNSSWSNWQDKFNMYQSMAQYYASMGDKARANRYMELAEQSYPGYINPVTKAKLERL